MCYIAYTGMKMNRYTTQKIALTLSIFIVLNLLFNYAIFAFYPSPDEDEFCGKETRQYYDNKDSCEAIGGEWVAYEQGPYPRPIKAINEFGEEFIGPTEYCDAEKSCREQYDEAMSFYNRNVFIALVSFGMLSFIAGFFLIAVPAISSGLLFGGLFSIFIGNIRYWSDMSEYLRVVVLIIVLAGLIWLGYRKLKDK